MVGAEQAQRAHLGHDVAVEALLAVGREHAREQLVLRIAARGVAHHALLLGELAFEVERILPVERGVLDGDGLRCSRFSAVCDMACSRARRCGADASAPTPRRKRFGRSCGLSCPRSSPGFKGLAVAPALPTDADGVSSSLIHAGHVRSVARQQGNAQDERSKRSAERRLARRKIHRGTGQHPVRDLVGREGPELLPAHDAAEAGHDRPRRHPVGAIRR